ncbi:MAG: FHA domain-containing protein [Methyloligellaceae bacterium]
MSMDEQKDDELEQTQIVNRKNRSGRTSLLQDALNAVDAALGNDGRRDGFDIESEETRVESLAASLSEQAESSVAGIESDPMAQNGAGAPEPEIPPAAQNTQRVRGRPEIPETDFFQEPVVGWLVIVDGPGLGSYRPIIEGNNSIGWAPNQHIRLDFGDDSISAEEQAFIRYDSEDRNFLFVPNLTKTNVVWVNETKPTSAVQLKAMDIITMGRTRVVFVPFCGKEFDWSELRK